ncbi:MAG TPA: nucleotidyltransferase family protein [Geobacterales bacterium]|nr:nucleotidyltransferase family protein [Geobacterales bacterium]
MRRDEAIDQLAAHLSDIRSQFHVESLAIFGSVARDEAKSQSDVDILVSYVKTPGLVGFLALKEYLETLLGAPVDLVTSRALKRQLRESIERESIRVH